MQKFTNSDGLSLAFTDVGRGPALLCLAGLTRNSHDFDEMAASLSGVRLIRMDYRGRGQSDWDPHPMNYSVPVESRDALELLDHLGLEKAAVIGSSRGGIIAMFLAATAKHRLSAVILNDVGPMIERAALGRIAHYIGIGPPYKNYDEAVAKYPAECVGFYNVSRERWLSEVTHLWRETPLGLANKYDPALSISVKATFDGPEVDLWPLFDALTGLPVALLRAENSDLLTGDTAAEMRRRRPDMLFAEVADRAHIPFLDEPESLSIINAVLAKLK